MESYPSEMVLPYDDYFLWVLMFDISTDWPKSAKFLYSQTLPVHTTGTSECQSFTTSRVHAKCANHRNCTCIYIYDIYDCHPSVAHEAKSVKAGI